MDNLDHFESFSTIQKILENFPKKFRSVSFEYLKSLNFMQNMKKT